MPAPYRAPRTKAQLCFALCVRLVWLAVGIFVIRDAKARGSEWNLTMGWFTVALAVGLVGLDVVSYRRERAGPGADR